MRRNGGPHRRWQSVECPYRETRKQRSLPGESIILKLEQRLEFLHFFSCEVVRCARGAGRTFRKERGCANGGDVSLVYVTLTDRAAHRAI